MCPVQEKKKHKKKKTEKLFCMPLGQHDSTKTVQTVPRVQFHLKTVIANLLNE